MELLEQFKQKEDIVEVSPDRYINGAGHLAYLNERAIKANYNRQLNIGNVLEAIELAHKTSPVTKSTRLPVSFSMIHNDTEVRVIFSWGEGNAQLDMSFADYDALPKISDLIDMRFDGEDANV
tara:strand:- start:811 stop:1179 length:369 start_codon:yes stop_codon:yes gene_type:complete